jgi:chromosome segregation ATPase
MFGEWRRRYEYPRVHVTHETIVPDKPKSMLSEPDDVAYHLKTAEIDEKIEVLNKEIKEIDSKLKQESSDMIDGQQARNPIQKELKSHFEELKIYTEKKRLIYANIEKLESQSTDLSKQRDKLRLNVHPIYNNIDKLEKGVKELERRLTTQSLAR